MNKVRTKSDIGKKVFLMAVVSILVVTTVFFVAYCISQKDNGRNSEKSRLLIALNEIDHLLEEDSEITVPKEKVQELMVSLEEGDMNLEASGTKWNWIFYGFSVASILILYLLVYIVILRPFAKLEAFAGAIADGNLDMELTYERVHLFGQFTWAFDHMRREIKRARQCEKEAVENNKTVIATLSHDIKTPIASIRAYSEALEVNMDSSAERRKRYIDVIMRKCDEVTKITNDMFLHSLHDLDKLVMKKERVDIQKVIMETVQSMQGDRTDIILEDIEACTLQDCDEDRIAQVLENVINNARKYAPGEVRICGFIGLSRNLSGDSLQATGTSMRQEGAQYIISIKDTGKGIADEDMPFIFEKFYRGKNSGEQPGAGLGLFIVKYIMEQMGGSVSIENHSDGMEVVLLFCKGFEQK